MKTLLAASDAAHAVKAGYEILDSTMEWARTSKVVEFGMNGFGILTFIFIMVVLIGMGIQGSAEKKAKEKKEKEEKKKYKTGKVVLNFKV